MLDDTGRAARAEYEARGRSWHVWLAVRNWEARLWWKRKRATPDWMEGGDYARRRSHPAVPADRRRAVVVPGASSRSCRWPTGPACPISGPDIARSGTTRIRRPGLAVAAKLDRDLSILNEQLAERPDEPFTLFNLKRIWRGTWPLGLMHWGTSLHSLALGTDGFDLRGNCLLIARCYQMLVIFRPPRSAVSRGFRSTWKMRPYGSAKRWCTVCAG